MIIKNFHFFPKIRKYKRKHYVQMEQVIVNWYHIMHEVKRVCPGIWKETGKILTQSIYGGKPI